MAIIFSASLYFAIMFKNFCLNFENDLLIFFYMGEFFYFQGITTYFSFNCDISDAEIAQEFMTSKVQDTQHSIKYSVVKFTYFLTCATGLLDVCFYETNA